MIVVFLKNKLVSCDTITPIMLAVKQQGPNKKIRFFIGDWRGYEAIRANVFLFDTITKIGSFDCYAKRPDQSLLLHRAWAMFWIAGMALRAVLGRIQFVHFQALNEWPFHFLARINPKKVFYFENTCWHYHANELLADNHGRERNVTTSILGSQNRVGFNSEWVGFEGEGGPKYHMPPSRQLAVWRDYVTENAQQWFEKEFKRVSLPENDKIIVFVLGAFVKLDFMRTEKSVENLLRETLVVLRELSDEYTVFIKPHAITDRTILDKILSEFEGNPFVITGLHPTLLASRAQVFISNYYSTTQADAVSMGVPTIEFSDYAQSYLQQSGGNSINPRYITNFVNQDVTEFRRVLHDVLQEQSTKQPLEALNDTSGIIQQLALG